MATAVRTAVRNCGEIQFSSFHSTLIRPPSPSTEKLYKKMQLTSIPNGDIFMPRSEISSCFVAIVSFFAAY